MYLPKQDIQKKLEERRRINKNKNERIHKQRIIVFSTIAIGLASLLIPNFESLPLLIKTGLSLIIVISILLVVNEYKVRNQFKDFPNVILGIPLFGELFNAIPPNSFYETVLYWRGIALGAENSRTNNLGEPFTVHALGKTVLCISNEEDLVWLMNLERKGYTEVVFPEAAKILFGSTNLMLQEGKHHKILRRIMEPLFSQNSLENYTKIMDQLVQKQLMDWSCSSSSEEEKWNSSKGFKMLTLQILLYTIFGDITDKMVKEFHDLLVLWWAGFSKLAFAIPGTTYSKALQAKHDIEGKIGELIEDFKQTYSESHEKAKSTSVGRLVYAKDSDGNMLSDQELKENILLILFAGHDSTYSSIGNFLYLLNTLQSNLHDALIEEVQNLKNPLENNDLRNNAPILNAFLAEAWRFRPPVVGGAREITTNDIIKYKENCIVPKGSHIYFSSFLGHEEYYGESAHTFQLERWLPNDHPFSLKKEEYNLKDFNQISRPFRTFGIGKHSCLGHYFAKLEARIIMVRMLQNYHVEVRNSQLVTQPFVFYVSDFKLSRKDP